MGPVCHGLPPDWLGSEVMRSSSPGLRGPFATTTWPLRALRGAQAFLERSATFLRGASRRWIAPFRSATKALAGVATSEKERAAAPGSLEPLLPLDTEASQRSFHASPSSEYLWRSDRSDRPAGVRPSPFHIRTWTAYAAML